MSEFVTVKSGTAGTDIDVATDDVTIGADPVKVQRVKQGFGADGDYTDVSADDPLPVVTRGADGTNGTINVTTGGVEILAAGIDRRAVWLENRGTAYVDVGVGASLGSGEGIRLYPGKVLVIDRSPNAAVRAIASTGTQAVSYMVESD